jgi:RHS repeat-associated protein
MWETAAFSERAQPASFPQPNGVDVSPPLCFDSANRITAQNCSAAAAFTYDSLGNLLTDGVNRYTYDAENRLIMSLPLGSQIATQYTYDANGRRVQVKTGSVSTDYVYDVQGHEVGQISESTAFLRGEIYAQARHIGTYADGTTYFVSSDWLGTERVRTNVAGAVCGTLSSLPFGDGSSAAGCFATPKFFTGKERDSDTGLDYFGARYYASTIGRWITPDWSGNAAAVPYADLNYPESLNLYRYVSNNPLAKIDVDGHWDLWQKFVNSLAGNGWKTDVEVAHEVAEGNRFYYTKIRGFDEKQFKAMTDAQVNAFDQAYQNGQSSFVSDGTKFILAANTASMLGANGTQVTSKTLWNTKGQGRIDVENPNPGQRAGQIHFQDNSGKYKYDVAKKEFTGLSATKNKELLSSPGVQEAIQKGLKYLGVAQ